eukprot:scaffold11294_cov56-Cyclotella_meneghiniana.AAC.5
MVNITVNNHHQQPLLLPKLQAALAILYSNHQSDNISNVNTAHAHHHQQQQHEAHQFLLSYKSSNLLRFVVSRIQSQKDRSGDNIINIGSSLEIELQRYINDAVCTDNTNKNGAVVIIGSIYLSCLSLLLATTTSSNSHERIFAAQTLNHRCRSIKLVECYDIEAEDGLECGVGRFVLAWDNALGMKKGAGDNNDDGAPTDNNDGARVILDAWRERYVPMLIHKCYNGGNAVDRHDGGRMIMCIPC